MEHIKPPITQGQYFENDLFDANEQWVATAKGLTPLAEQRAAEIVQAVNAYDDLVAQRDEMLDALKADKAYILHLHICPLCRGGHTCEDGLKLLAKAGDLRDRAIAKAEGKEGAEC